MLAISWPAGSSKQMTAQTYIESVQFRLVWHDAKNIGDRLSSFFPPSLSMTLLSTK